MSSKQIMTCRFCGRDDLTPQGHGSHEQYCDENPNRGIPPAKQQELGLLDNEQGAPPKGTPDPDQSDGEPDDGLPTLTEMEGRDKSNSPKPEQETGSCPVCDHGEVMDAGDAKDSYTSQVTKPHAKAVLAYELADYACMNPDCGAVWGEEYDEPLPMEVIVNA